MIFENISLCLTSSNIGSLFNSVYPLGKVRILECALLCVYYASYMHAVVYFGHAYMRACICMYMHAVIFGRCRIQFCNSANWQTLTLIARASPSSINELFAISGLWPSITNNTVCHFASLQNPSFLTCHLITACLVV